MSSLLPVLCGAAATLGSGVAAGVYIAFSARVMPRLAALPAHEGIATMQQFNRNAVQPPFMIAFFGAAAACTVLGIHALAQTPKDAAAWLSIAGSAAYLASFAITIAYNVPRNEALARLRPGTPASAAPWLTFVREWTAANTVRAVCAGAGTAALAGATLLSLLKR